MLYTITEERPARLTVLSYDIHSPRRAYRVRKALEPWRQAKQYSVYETLLGYGEFRGLIAELAECCDFATDRLAAWWPLAGLRLIWDKGRLLVGARNGEASDAPARLPPYIGDFVLCYDIADSEALIAVAAVVGAETARVQRSVYWLRAPANRLASLMGRCRDHLAEEDRLWAYPLRGSHALWQIGEREAVVLPIATHHWSTS